MYPDEPRGPKDFPTEIAKGIGLAAGGLTAGILAADAGLPPLWWWLAVVSAAVIGVGGLFYALATAAEWFVVLQGDEPPAGQDGGADKPDQERPNGTAEFVSRPAARTQPEWRVKLERRFYSDDRFLVGNRPVYLPDTIDVDHIYLLAEWRAAGRLPDISTRSLHEIGITRFGEPPNAQSLIEFLLTSGAIQDGGERRPYVWTQAGEDTFPSPLPRNGNNNNNSSGGGGTSGTHHSTTTTTGYHH